MCLHRFFLIIYSKLSHNNSYLILLFARWSIFNVYLYIHFCLLNKVSTESMNDCSFSRHLIGYSWSDSSYLRLLSHYRGGIVMKLFAFKLEMMIRGDVACSAHITKTCKSSSFPCLIALCRWFFNFKGWRDTFRAKQIQ